MKIKPELPYMTVPERSMFKKLVKGDQITMFRMGSCEHCGGEMVKHKRFCSWECFDAQEGEDGEDNTRKMDR